LEDLHLKSWSVYETSSWARMSNDQNPRADSWHIPDRISGMDAAGNVRSSGRVPEGRVCRLCSFGLWTARRLRQRLAGDRGACRAREMERAVFVSVRPV